MATPTIPRSMTISVNGEIRQWVVLLVVSLSFIVAGIVAYSIHNNRIEIERRATSHAESLTRLIDQNTSGTLLRSDMALQLVVQDVERRLATGTVMADPVNDYIVRMIRLNPELLSMRVVDAEGVVRYGADKSGAVLAGNSKVNVSDRDYFRRARDASGSELIITPPFFGRLISTWVFQMVRRISLPDGSFGGIAYVAFDIQYLENMLQTANVGPRGVASLRTLDFGMIARYSPSAQGKTDMSKNAVSDTLREKIKAEPNEGAYQAASGIDGIARLFAYRKMQVYPGYVFVGIAEEDLLADWRRESAILVGLAVLFVIILVLGAWALERSRRRIQVANIAKSQFLATMSHEIRTPMNGILGMAQMLLMDNIEEAERRDFARTILNSGQTLLTLLNDILDFSKIEADKLDLNNTVFDPEQILRETANLFQENAANKGLVLEVHWQGAAQRYIADPHRLRQMLSNLINNAIKFTAKGKVSLQAKEIERANDSALIEFSVSDTGTGIEKDKLELLFKPFSQADSSITRQFGGTGLGLSIVRSLAQKMGGDVGVESTLGNGSRFWFRIRASLVKEDIDARSSFRANTEMSVSASPGQIKGNILVVEDNPTNQIVIKALLGKLSLDCQLASDGQVGFQAVQQDPTIDLILMDLQMPVMDGYEATKAIRNWETEAGQRRRLIIALTADAFDEDRQRCLDAGMDDFLTKPVSLDKLTLALQHWLPADKV